MYIILILEIVKSIINDFLIIIAFALYIDICCYEFNVNKHFSKFNMLGIKLFFCVFDLAYLLKMNKNIITPKKSETRNNFIL